MCPSPLSPIFNPIKATNLNLNRTILLCVDFYYSITIAPGVKITKFLPPGYIRVVSSIVAATSNHWPPSDHLVSKGGIVIPTDVFSII